MTNTLPIHRLSMNVGDLRTAPAAYVRALDGQVERLEQEYVCTVDDPHTQHYAYRAPAIGFAAELVYDRAGLILAYPGIAERAG